MSEISFRIHSLFCGIEKGQIERRKSLDISKNGVVDDYHKDRHIILLDNETYQIMNQNRDSALCMSKFYAHIIIDKRINFILNNKLSHKDKTLTVVQCGKKCHMHQGCQYYLNKYECLLSKYTYYLESESNSEINVNEEWGIK